MRMEPIISRTNHGAQSGMMNRELPVSPWAEWTITEKIGEGAYGTVYKAMRSEQGHTIFSAIKVISIPESREELNTILQETGDEQSARMYFGNVCQDCLEEISMMEYFRGNSHIVSVEDYKVTEYLDEIGWDIFIRMEYLTSFPDYSAGKSFDRDEILKLGMDICRALQYLGRQQIVHRDVKPDNIFVSRFGDYKLGDFGIARKLERSLGELSRKGTESYMAPEIYRGDAYDARADIYSLGIVLYRMLNRNRLPLINPGKQLITYHDKEEAVLKRMSGEPIPPPSEADRTAASIILKACAYAPEDRYQTPEEMLRDLVLASQGLEADQRYSFEPVKTAQDQEPEPVQVSRGQEKKPEVIPGQEPVPEREMIQKQKAEEAPPAKKSRRKHRKKSRRLRILLPAAAAAVAVAAFILAGFYLRKMLVDTVREQTAQMLLSIQARSEVPSEETGQDFASSIELISERATTIVSELPDYTVTGTEGRVLKYYNDDEELRKVLVYPEESAEGVYEEYFYWNGELFFAYIWDSSGEEMYYYRDGILIRWIDLDGNVHDNEQENEEYIERGDKYWINSILRRE